MSSSLSRRQRVVRLIPSWRAIWLTLALAGTGGPQDRLMLQLRQGEQRLSHHLVRQQAMTMADGGRERGAGSVPHCNAAGHTRWRCAAPQVAGPG